LGVVELKSVDGDRGHWVVWETPLLEECLVGVVFDEVDEALIESFQEHFCPIGFKGDEFDARF
jgi:hypothetical protein